jgi:hypothetical protein
MYFYTTPTTVKVGSNLQSPYASEGSRLFYYSYPSNLNFYL